MRLKLTLVLFLANVAVFFALWRLDREVAAVVAPSGPLTPEMTDLDQVTINGRLLPEAPQPRTLVREPGGNWRITSPVNWPANNFAVQNLVNQLQFLEQEASFPADQLASSGQTLGDYGLADPGLTLTLGAGAGAHTETLLVGAPTKLGSRLYVMNPADHLIRVVPQELLQTLVLPMEDLRNARIFSLPYFEVRQMSVRGTPPPDATGPGPVAPPAGGQGLGAPKVTLVKNGDQWVLDTPVRCPADTGLVNGVVAQLDALTVTRFLTPAEQDPVRQGLTNPSMRVTLTGTTSQTLLLGQRVVPAPATPGGNVTASGPAQYYAQLEGTPTVFTVPAGPFEILQNAQDSLRDRKFLAFNATLVSSLTVQFGSHDVRIQKLESGPWQVVARDAAGTPVPVPADTAVVQGLLDNLQKLEAVNFTSDAPSQDDLHTYGLDDPQRVVTLQGATPAANLTFSLGVNQQATPVRYYMQVKDSSFVYEVGPAVLGWLQTDPLHYRDRVLEALPAAAEIRSLQLTDLTSNRTVVNLALDAQNTTWEAVLAPQPEPDRDAVNKLLQTVRKFEVASYLQANFTANYRLDPQTPTPWHYRLDAGIRLPGASPTAAPATWACYFTDRLGGLTQIGGTPQPPMIFTLTQPLIDALYTLTLAQTPPPPVQKALLELPQPIDPRLPATPAPATAPAPATPTAVPASAPTPATAGTPAVSH